MQRSGLALEFRAPSNDVPRARPRRGRRRIVLALVGCACLAGATLGLRQLRAPMPALDRSVLWIDRVERGEMVREVNAQGTLVPTDIRWITAVVAARVDRVRVLPGTKVQPDTVLVDLVNPDTELQALQADLQLAQARAELTTLEASLTNQRLAQQSAVASLDAEHEEAHRRASADETLEKQGLVSPMEMATSRGKASALATKKAFEEQRLSAMAKGEAAQVEAQRRKVEQLRTLAAFRRQELAALQVRAGVAGVLEELPLQSGQSVTVGALLAKLVQPDKLKAELRVPAVQAGEVQLGQPATVDAHHGVVTGRVVRIDPAAVSGTVKVDVEFDGPLPSGARPDLSIEGTIELERMGDVLHVGRPATAQPERTAWLFKVVGDGEAVRTRVQLGKASVKTIEIQSGLAVGDRIILSDMSQWDGVERVRLR